MFWAHHTVIPKAGTANTIALIRLLIFQVYFSSPAFSNPITITKNNNFLIHCMTADDKQLPGDDNIKDYAWLEEIDKPAGLSVIGAMYNGPKIVEKWETFVCSFILFCFRICCVKMVLLWFQLFEYLVHILSITIENDTCFLSWNGQVEVQNNFQRYKFGRSMSGKSVHKWGYNETSLYLCWVVFINESFSWFGEFFFIWFVSTLGETIWNRFHGF